MAELRFKLVNPGSAVRHATDCMMWLQFILVPQLYFLTIPVQKLEQINFSGSSFAVFAQD